MANIKRFSHIAVIFQDEARNTIKFVTKIEGRNALWEAGKPALKVSDAAARDVQFGLCCNGYTAVIVKAIDGQILENPA